MAELILIIVTCVFALLGTHAMLKHARSSNLLDVPNERSSHNAPTPSGGGLAIVVTVTCAFGIASFFDLALGETLIVVSIGGGLVAAIGLLDDYRDVRASWRFLAHLISACFVVYFLGAIDSISIGGEFIKLGFLGIVLTVFWIVWLTNLYNFMDGIDGLAASQAITTSLSLGLILMLIGDFQLALMVFILGASCLGFVFLNWPPAKIFMGDVGSSYLGFVFGALSIVSHVLGILSIWVWFIVLGLFIVDATFTLLTRMIRQDHWRSAHRNHSYQKASRRFGSHRPVTLAVILINLLWLLPLAWFAAKIPEFGWWLTIVAWTPLCILAFIFRAGRPDESNA